MIYYGLLCIIWIFALSEAVRSKGSKMILLPVSFLMVWFLVGLRWQTGTDWDPYIQHYAQLGDLGFEAGYVWLAKLCSFFDMSYSSFLLIISFVPLAAIFIFLNIKTRYLFVALMFFAANYMLGFMGGNRQSIAIGLIVLSTCFIEDRKPVEFFLFVVVASLFHSSAAVYLPAYFMTEKRIPLIAKYSFVAILVVFGREAAPIMLKALRVLLDTAGFHGSAFKVAAYIDQIVFYGFTWSSVVKKVLLLIVFDLAFNRMNTQNRNATLYNNLYFFSIVIDTLFGPINVAFMRAGTYYRIAEILLVAKLFECIRGRELKFLAYACLLVYCVRQLYAAISYYPDLYEPYRSIFF